MESEPDYVTVNAAMEPGKFNTVIMRWSAPADSYLVHKCSEALPEKAARYLAESWAAAMGGLEIR